MRKSYLWVSVLVMSASVSTVAVLLALLLPRQPEVAALGGVGLSLVSALLVRWALRRDLDRLNKGLRLLPDLDPGLTSLPGDFEETVEKVGEVSAGLKRKLALAEEERRQLEAVLDAMEDAVVAVDSTGRIQWTNLKMRKMIVLPGGGVSGVVRVGHALVQTIRDPEVLECVRLALEEGTMQVRRTAMSGRTFEVNASTMPAGGAVAVLHDVTRVEEMERTQRDFVANVSHELRTPLTSIVGYVETLLDHEKGISPQAREFLGTIFKNATRMTRLTEDLLVMARVEASSVQLNPAPVPADLLIRDALAAMSGLVQENEAVLELGEMTETQVFADTDAVMQILSNLIENAIKYGRGRNGAAAWVTVSAREVHEPYEAVEFRVQDFGMGIASEHLGRIFERFYRVDKTRSRESGGTGLGLSIVRHMVQVQAGTIRAESELGLGSTFVFTLPRALYPVVYERTLQ